MTNLDKLIDAVEAGRVSLATIEDMAIAALGLGDNAITAGQAYRGSLDAAKSLHDALLPGWTLTFLGQEPYDWKAAVFKERYGPRREGVCAGNPARAWLLAILKAHRAQVHDD